MDPTDEELMHRYYGGDDAALERLIERHDELLTQFGELFLLARTGSPLQVASEGDTDERVVHVWTHVFMTRHAVIGTWPYARLSVLTWLVHLLCLELDRHLGLRGPF
jgi:hypothetical protein